MCLWFYQKCKFDTNKTFFFIDGRIDAVCQTEGPILTHKSFQVDMVGVIDNQLIAEVNKDNIK